MQNALTEMYLTQCFMPTDRSLIGVFDSSFWRVSISKENILRTLTNLFHDYAASTWEWVIFRWQNCAIFIGYWEWRQNENANLKGFNHDKGIETESHKSCFISVKMAEKHDAPIHLNSLSTKDKTCWICKQHEPPHQDLRSCAVVFEFLIWCNLDGTFF